MLFNEAQPTVPEVIAEAFDRMNRERLLTPAQRKARREEEERERDERIKELTRQVLEAFK